MFWRQDEFINCLAWLCIVSLVDSTGYSFKIKTKDMSSKTVSIIGCGWLGFPLAERLISAGYIVKGSSRTVEKLEILAGKDILPYQISVSGAGITADKTFFDCDYLIINIPPGTKSGKGNKHPDQVGLILDQLDLHKTKVLYISSTSVYPDLNLEFQESDVPGKYPAGNTYLLNAEQQIQTRAHNWLILRCAGLAGYDRMLARHFAGKSGLSGGNSPVNLIHRDDVVNIIHNLLSSSITNETFNLSAPVHPLKKDFYTSLAARFQLQLPVFADSGSIPGKVISSSKIQQVLSYRFLFPDPGKFAYTSF